LIHQSQCQEQDFIGIVETEQVELDVEIVGSVSQVVSHNGILREQPIHQELINMNQLPINEIITGILAGLIGWFTSGKFTKQSIEVQNAQAVLSMWKETATSQKIDIQQLKEEMREMVKRIEELENHIFRLEIENKELKKQLSIV
jgi:septal ring factor EnvC (AmiA/AmiB activator)